MQKPVESTSRHDDEQELSDGPSLSQGKRNRELRSRRRERGTGFVVFTESSESGLRNPPWS